MIKSRILKWEGYVTRVREKHSYRFLILIANREIGHLYNLRYLCHSMEEHGQEWSCTFFILCVMTNLKTCVIQNNIHYSIFMRSS